VLSVASPAYADSRNCTCSLGSISAGGDATVPPGAACTLRGIQVDGNVQVK